MIVQQHYSLLGHNTFGIDARCLHYVEIEQASEVGTAIQLLNEWTTPYIIIGGGSNLLLTADYPGTVIRSAIKGIEHVGADRLRVGSGVEWDALVDYALQHQLYGAENLSLIPGDVGASAVQNIGAYGAEARELITQVEAVDLQTGAPCTFQNVDCNYGYRDSRFKHEWRGRYFITVVEFRFSTEFHPRLDYGNIRSELERRGISTPTASELRQVIIDIRREKLPDPAQTGNAGSFFMNPVVSREKYEQLAAQYPEMPHYTVDAHREKIPAGWMIEQCGLKGRSLGRAGVHPRQALVLVNLGGATGSEIVALCQAIQHDVKQRFDIDIHPEVNII